MSGPTVRGASVARSGTVRLPGGREKGSATAELAVALPAVVLVLLALLLAATAGAASFSCVDAARAGARAASLGSEQAVVMGDAQRVAGPGARVAVSREGAWVRVTVHRDVAVGGATLGGTVTVSGSASVRMEPGA